MIKTEMKKIDIVDLVESCKLLGVPILATEQYPKGLGPTVEEVGLTVSKSILYTLFVSLGEGLK